MEKETPMDNISPVKPKLRKRRRVHVAAEKSWFKKNLKTLFIIAIALLLGQSFRGCINTSSLERQIKKIEYANDSISLTKEQQYADLQIVLDDSQDENQRLIYELKVAGVIAIEAEKRAAAIQRTADKIKQNTTITIEADTTRNHIRK